MTDQIPLTDTHLSVTDLSDEQVRNASLALAGYACGAGELAEWLEICGLRSYQAGDRMWTGRPKQVRAPRRKTS